jgi:hypothetical protein
MEEEKSDEVVVVRELLKDEYRGREPRRDNEEDDEK